MNRVKVLHIGIKNWPHDVAFSKQELVGIRGGGINKYCNILLNALPDTIETFIITQRLQGQSSYEIDNGIHVYRRRTIGGRALRQILMNIRSFFIAILIIRKHKIDILHGHMLHGVMPAFVLAKLFNIKVIGTPYSISTKYDHASLNWLTKSLDVFFYGKLDRVIFETEENRNKVYELRNLEFHNSLVIHTGINLPELKNHLPKRGEKIKIFYIGRLVKVKAIDKLILSLRYMDKQIKDMIHIDIVGEGELFESHKSLIDDNNFNELIKMHGFVEDSEAFFQESEIFILPSDIEGFSISLLEAMSHGKACIINDFGVPFSKSDLLIMENNDPETIAKSISYLVNNREKISELGINARRIIEKKFSVDSFAAKYADVYKDVI